MAAKAGGLLKKTVLELGGSDPYLVLADADLEAAVETCVASRLINSGQSCIAAKRFIVERPIAAEFIDRFVERMRATKMGDPLDEANDLGPQARADLRDDLHRQVEASVARGARCLLGGTVPPGPGAYYPPTVLVDVAPGMPAYDEELFGPVAAIIVAADEDDAVRIANDSVFGLGAAVFTGDAGPRRADRRPPPRRRRLLRQRLRQVRPPPPLRRHQAVRLRPRAGGLRDPRVRQRQDGVRGVAGASDPPPGLLCRRTRK